MEFPSSPCYSAQKIVIIWLNSKIWAPKFAERKKSERIYPAIQILLSEQPGSGCYPASFLCTHHHDDHHPPAQPPPSNNKNANKNTTIKQDNNEADSPTRSGGGGGGVGRALRGGLSGGTFGGRHFVNRHNNQPKVSFSRGGGDGDEMRPSDRATEAECMGGAYWSGEWGEEKKERNEQGLSLKRRPLAQPTQAGPVSSHPPSLSPYPREVGIARLSTRTNECCRY